MKPEFTKLWNSYPGDMHPCDGPWPNQCAIRLSVALNAEGTIRIDKTTYPEPRCAHGHARGAESLANFLVKAIGMPSMFKDAKDAKVKLLGKNGIIFFKDCFIRGGETTRSGDHIDVWKLGKARTYDDPNNESAQVWFWAL
jgi:hypothetical protein